MTTSKANENNWLTTLFIIAAIAFVIYEYNACQERNIKARAYDIMEEEPDIDSDEALEQAEMEHDDAMDAMYENSQY